MSCKEGTVIPHFTQKVTEAQGGSVTYTWQSWGLNPSSVAWVCTLNHNATLSLKIIMMVVVEVVVVMIMILCLRPWAEHFLSIITLNLIFQQVPSVSPYPSPLHLVCHYPSPRCHHLSPGLVQEPTKRSPRCKPCLLSGTAGSGGSSVLSFLRNCQLFSTVLYPFTFSPAEYEGSISPHPHQC